MNTCSCGFFVNALFCMMFGQISFAYHIMAQTKDSLAVKSSPCKHVDIALYQAETMLQHLRTSSSRDSSTVNSIVQYTRLAHDSSLVCHNHLSAMMFLATSEAAKKLLAAENILMFRLKVRDVQIFLAEARKYWTSQDTTKN